MLRTISGSAVAAVVAIAAFTIGVPLTAQEAMQAAPVSAALQRAAASPGPATLFAFTGGPVRRFAARVQDSPITIGETPGFNALPGASITLNVRANQFDAFVVTFSGECRLFGASADDWITLEVRRNGVPLEPQNPSGDVFAFCSNDSWESNSATFVTSRLFGGAAGGPGTNHTFTVHWRLVDSAPAGTLQGWLDDWTFLVTQFE